MKTFASSVSGIVSFISLLAALLASPARSQAADVLGERAREAATIIAAEPKWRDDLFDASFTKQVPPEQLRAIGKQTFARTGAVVEVQETQRKGAYTGDFDVICAGDVALPMWISIQERAPHAIVGLFYKQPAPLMKDVGAAVGLLKKLPGKVSFAAWKLGEKPEILAELEPETSLAIGSAFKLYVLGALAEDVAEKKRALADVVVLDAKRRSMPSGMLHEWPAGTPITLATLASLMISISDNTATDELVATLGREKVEAMLAPMGNRSAERTQPFLTTGEMFRLKFTREGKGADEYAKLDLSAKRAYLMKEVANGPLDESSFESSRMAAPFAIDTVEWFASAADLCRALDWLRVHTESGPAAPLRDVLAINAGVQISHATFPYAGFKGGSEPGVMALAFLLRANDGTWYAIAVAWNDTKDLVDEAKLAALVQRTIYVLGKRGTANTARDPAAATPK